MPTLNIRFREPEDPGWTKAPNSLLRNPKISAAALRLYLVIRSHSYGPPPNQEQIGDECGFTPRQARFHLAKLKAFGLITVERPSKREPNIYWIEPVPQALPDIDTEQDVKLPVTNAESDVKLPLTTSDHPDAEAEVEAPKTLIQDNTNTRQDKTLSQTAFEGGDQTPMNPTIKLEDREYTFKRNTQIIEALEAGTYIPPVEVRVTPKEKGSAQKESTRLPWNNLTHALHESIPEAIRPTRCHFAAQEKDAKALYEQGWTEQQIRDATEWAYKHDRWVKGENKDHKIIIIGMWYMTQHIKAYWPLVERWKREQTPVPNGGY